MQLFPPFAAGLMFSGRHGTEVVVRSLVAPAAPAVVGGFVVEAHVGRGPDVDRRGVWFFDGDVEGEFRPGEGPFRRGRIEADGEVVLTIFPVILNTDSETAAEGDPVFAVLESEGAFLDASRLEGNQSPEVRRKGDLLSIGFDCDPADGSRQREDQREHGGVDRTGRGESGGVTADAFPEGTEFHPAVELSAGDGPAAGENSVGGAARKEGFRGHPRGAAPPFPDENPFQTADAAFDGEGSGRPH